MGDDWDLYIVSTGVWMNRDRTLISYAPLVDEVFKTTSLMKIIQIFFSSFFSLSYFIQQELLEFKKRPDQIAFQKAKVCA